MLFLQTFLLSLRGGCCYSSCQMQLLYLVIWRVGTQPGVEDGTLHWPTRGTFRDSMALSGRPANWLWQVSHATFPEATGGLPATEMCVGQGPDGCHSSSPAASAALFGMPFPRSCPGPLSAVSASAHLLCVSDSHSNLRITTQKFPLSWTSTQCVPQEASILDSRGCSRCTGDLGEAA